ncbi:hypothetical protein J6G99_07555 [bacterium]|nr:hypothetical protein [bacterium]
MNEQELKEKIELRIDKYTDSYIEEIDEKLAQVILGINQLSASFSMIGYLQALKKFISKDNLD